MMVGFAQNPSGDGSLRLSRWMMGCGATALLVTMFTVPWFIERISLRSLANLSGVTRSMVERSTSVTAWDVPGIGRWVWLGTVAVALGAVGLVVIRRGLGTSAQQRICLVVMFFSLCAAIQIVSAVVDPQVEGGTAQVQVVPQGQSPGAHLASHASGGASKQAAKPIPIQFEYHTKIGIWLGLIEALVIGRGALFWRADIQSKQARHVGQDTADVSL